MLVVGMGRVFTQPFIGRKVNRKRPDERFEAVGWFVIGGRPDLIVGTGFPPFAERLDLSSEYAVGIYIPTDDMLHVVSGVASEAVQVPSNDRVGHSIRPGNHFVVEFWVERVRFVRC